jgi:signal transduction histidine kinase
VRKQPFAAGRAAELAGLCSYLQSTAEEERAALARALHDELGGLLIGARMETSWLEQQLPASDPALRARCKQVQERLAGAVDIMRRLEEGLRPALLDNLGLEAALSWQVADCRARAGLRCLERYPTPAPDFAPHAAIAIFRIIEQALGNVVRHARARELEVSLAVQSSWLIVTVRDDGEGLPAERLKTAGTRGGLAAMRHRAEALGGEWRLQQPAGGGTRIEVRLPLARVLRKGGA